MAHRGDFGRTGIARQNAEVFIVVASWLSRMMLLTALVCFAATTAVGLHAHVVVVPSDLFHHAVAGGTAGSLRNLIIMLAVTFVGVTLVSLMLSRDAFARGAPGAVATLLATARRLFRGARRGASVVVGSPALRPGSRVDRDTDNGILRQLRSALSIAPVGPPASLALGSDPWGLFGQSGHRTEVCAAA
jgi:hypothetical protein